MMVVVLELAVLGVILEFVAGCGNIATNSRRSIISANETHIGSSDGSTDSSDGGDDSSCDRSSTDRGTSSDSDSGGDGGT